jgi:regulator of replication initiation timing
MFIIDDIEKLIKEHGSASILRDHVALLRERFAMLEQDNAALKEKLAIFTSEKEALNAEIQKLKTVIREQNKDGEKISKQPETNIFHGNVPKEQMEILEYSLPSQQ